MNPTPCRDARPVRPPVTTNKSAYYAPLESGRTDRASLQGVMRLVCCLALLLVAAGVRAQEWFAIRVDAIDEYTHGRMEPDSVRVDVMETDSTKVHDDITLDRLTSLGFKRRPLILRFRREGFLSRCVNVAKPGPRVVYANLDPVIMQRDLNAARRERRLDEVTVTASVVKMVHRGDTIVYNADAFQLAGGSMLDELVRALPGVELRGGGRIYVNGRFVSDLLLNGKDFFSGNPTVALSNLPSYMVNNVKVYEKETAMTRVDPTVKKPLVMDVNLKKDYMQGWIANAQAGYGTDNRYVGRLFGLSFRALSRLALFGSANNTNDDSTPGEDNEWNPDAGSEGIISTHKAGVDYLLTDSRERWKFNPSATVTRRRLDHEADASATLFLPGGDMNRRSASELHTGSYDFTVSPRFEYSHKRTMVKLTPELNYSRFRSNSLATSAMSDAGGSTLNAERRHTTGRTDRWDGRLRLGSMFNVPSTPDYIMIDATADFENNRGATSGAYALDYPQQPQDNEGRQYSQFDPANRQSVWARAKYAANFTLKGGYRTKLTAWYAYRYAHRKDNRRYYDALTADGSEMLPSDAAIAPALALNTDNSYRSDLNESGHAVGLEYTQEFPGSGSLTLAPSVRRSRRRLDYERFGRPYRLRRNRWLFEPRAELEFSSIFNLTYELKVIEPSMIDLLDITDNTNPLYIVKGNSGLRPALNHNVELTLGILEELMHSDTWATVRLGYRQTDRAIARSAAYDATTGVTTYRPVNVRGNRSADATVSAGYYLDRPHNLMLTTTTEAEYVNSVDMIAALRSTVRTATLAERLKLEWKIIDGLSVDAVGNVRWRHSSSPQAGFATLNALDVDYGLILRATRLPWDMSFTTDLMMHTRRGYADSRLNDDRLVWNARLAKSILRGNLTFAIDGFDILGRLSNVVYDVNAQGRTETRYNTLPRYAMLHVIYRLNLQPKKR